MKYLIYLLYLLPICLYISTGIGAMFLADYFEKGNLNSFCIVMAGIGSFYHGVDLFSNFRERFK